MDVYIRGMVGDDLEQVLRIERAGFTHPWTEEDFNNAAFERTYRLGVAQGPRGLIVGYHAWRIGPAKRSIELASLAVHPDYRAMGVGRRLVEDLAKLLDWRRHASITASVIESNKGAHLFLKRCGFRCVGCLPAGFCQPPEPGLAFRRWCDTPMRERERREAIGRGMQ